MPNDMNATPRYDRTSVILHWLIAAIIVANSILAFVAEAQTREARPPYMNIHAIMGVLVLALTLWRVVNRFSHPAPPLHDPKWVVTLSKVGHGLLYLGTILLPISGALAYGFRGRALNFGLFQIPSPLTPNTDLAHSAGETHETMFWLMAVVVAGHVGAALWHQFVWKDGLLNRMRLG